MPGRKISQQELEQLIAQKCAEVARMPAQERVSMYASQALGYIAAEIAMSVQEDKRPAESAKALLGTLLAALDGDAGVYLTQPDLVHRVMQLTPPDRAYVRERVQELIDEL